MQNQKDNDQNKNEAPKTEAEEHRDERIEKNGTTDAVGCGIRGKDPSADHYR